VMLNGRGPYRMLIDTGCSFSMISPEVAAAIEPREADPQDDDVPAVNGLGDAIAVPRVILESVTLGDARFEGVVAGVVPLEIQSKIESRTMDGILGYSLFSNLFFALDYPRRRLILSDTWPADLPPIRAGLPITEHAGVPFVAVQLQGKQFDVMIDTGANDRFHLPPASVAALRWKVAPRPGFLLAVAGGGREQIARLSGDLHLGPLRQVEPVVGISVGPPTIGVGLLDAFCVIFDEADDKVWFCSAQHGPMPSPPARTVGLSLLADPGGWLVAGIIPQSPAEAAGIDAGDLVTRIEGRPASDWTPDQVQDWIETHPSLALRVSGKSGERDLDLRVWKLIP